MANQILTKYCHCSRCGDINGYSKKDLTTKTIETVDFERETTDGYDPDIRLIHYKVIRNIYLFRCPNCGYMNTVGAEDVKREKVKYPHTTI